MKNEPRIAGERKPRARVKKRLDRPKLSVTRDRPVLIFIWKWKVVTTQAVCLKFRAEFSWTPERVYQRLTHLKANGFLQLVREDVNEGRVWMLTPLGFQAIRDVLPALKEEGFASEHVSHDLLVLAAHLGEWITRFPADGTTIVTEQQLRRYENEILPPWVPVSQTHRPDGYWNIPLGDRSVTIALEVERSGKGVTPYRKVGDFYNLQREIDSVIWIVDSKQTLERMISAFRSTPSSFRDIHNFIWLQDFTSYGWESKIVLGPSRGQKFSGFLTQGKPSTDARPVIDGPTTPVVGQILDTMIDRRNYSKSRRRPDSLIS